MRDLHETRTSLVKAETSKTHLEQRAEELSRRLQGDAERLAVYERRSSAVNGATHHIGAEGASPEAEMADLRFVAFRFLFFFCAARSRRLFLALRSGRPRLTWLRLVIISNNSRRSARPVKKHWRRSIQPTTSTNLPPRHSSAHHGYTRPVRVSTSHDHSLVVYRHNKRRFRTP